MGFGTKLSAGVAPFQMSRRGPKDSRLALFESWRLVEALKFSFEVHVLECMESYADGVVLLSSRRKAGDKCSKSCL